jgi:hypothetical protein
MMVFKLLIGATLASMHGRRATLRCRMHQPESGLVDGSCASRAWARPWPSDHGSDQDHHHPPASRCSRPTRPNATLVPPNWFPKDNPHRTRLASREWTMTERSDGIALAAVSWPVSWCDVLSTLSRKYRPTRHQRCTVACCLYTRISKPPCRKNAMTGKFLESNESMPWCGWHSVDPPRRIVRLEWHQSASKCHEDPEHHQRATRLVVVHGRNHAALGS